MAEIVSKDPVTEAGQKTVSSRSHFSLGAPHFNTYRFGEYGCMDAIEIVPDDRNFRVALRHKLMTYTLGQPLLSKALLKKDCFYVPAQCILPRNWDKVYTNPLRGDDVDASKVGSTVVDFSGKIAQCFDAASSCLVELSESNANNNVKLEYYLKYWLDAEMFFSNGSLLNQLGIKLAPLCYVVNHLEMSFDKGFDAQMNSLSGKVNYFTVNMSDRDGNEISYRVYVSALPSTFDRQIRCLTLREFLCLARDGFDWTVMSVVLESGVSALPVPYTIAVLDDRPIDVNLARPAAYQICCAHYYSNDKIDYIYDANLYRQNIYDCLIHVFDDSDNLQTGDEFVSNCFFTMNGSKFEYDYLSAYCFDVVCSELIRTMDEADYVSSLKDLFLASDYWRLLFGFNRSLRFADYFTNSKSQPLAVGDYNVAVGQNGVNVISMVKGIQQNKFLNAVQRFGRRIAEYTKGLFPGVSVTPDYHDPFFLGHTTDVIGAQEIENTADEQRARNSITTILRSENGQYGFETDFEKPGIFVSIIYFDIERAYAAGVDRAVQHVDRFDMFNPFLQFTGDQEIRGSELTTISTGYVGYTLNYMEYKTRVPQVSGGFVEFLPGYAFLSDFERHVDDQGNIHVSPSFIRSSPTELDKFYTSLAGSFSLASYFHFIVMLDNQIEVDRPMAYAPSLL